MSYSAKIITKYDGYDYKLRFEVVKNIMLKHKNFFSYSYENDCSPYVRIYICEYFMSESDSIMYLNCDPEKSRVKFRDDEESYIEAIYFENPRGMDFILKFLYEYFMFYPEDYFVEWNYSFDKKDIDRIYNSDDWEGWAFYGIQSKTFRELSEQEPIMKIRQPLKRAGRYVVILCRICEFDFDKLRDNIISFLKNHDFEYYSDQREDLVDIQYTHYALGFNTGKSYGNLFEFDLYEEVDYSNAYQFDIIEKELCIAMTIKYMCGGENIIKEYMYSHFDKYPHDYMIQSTTYEFTRAEDHIYTKDTISTFGE